ncbi:hypothetical protein K503DRAFT_864857 [Rhizopogon vinicolor AM-OR11-026]|uniref:Uncharacterized protein n=1 Tax=Rhizopogon vinicolor AM-OR11-026 TaxID=1314800 RepID=A0A1B7N5J3_9AGAM|nr:hypothetical protein K503DRAFT_864857 [Rhizopogon vinicolor AM-OR11-026]
MRGVSGVGVHGGPAKPSETQHSAWHAHPSIRKVILFLWGLVISCAGWAVVAMLIGYPMFVGVTKARSPSQLWSFLPEKYARLVSWTFRLSGGVTVRSSSRIMMMNPLKSFFTDPLGLVIFVAKPALHWMFGLSFDLSSQDDDDDRMLSKVTISMYTAKIWDLCITLFVFACFFTLVALYRPRGPQPAAYGHLQTLSNLVDEWSPVMWWGHKEGGIPYCHAGTSDHLLPPAKMDCVYAGVGSHPSVSGGEFMPGDALTVCVTGCAVE